MPKKYTEEEIREAISNSTSFKEAGKYLNTNPGCLAKRAKRLEIDYSHFKRKIFSDKAIEEAVKNSSSIIGVLRHLGASTKGGSHWNIKRRVLDLEIDTSHFKREKRKIGSRGKLSADEALVLETKLKARRSHDFLKRALLEIGREEICEGCSVGTIWNGLTGIQELRIQIDHIDGNPFNNVRENLHFLCPNCHSQTSTWGFKGRGTGRKDTKETSLEKKIRLSKREKFKTTREELEKLVWEKTLVQIAKEFNVSDNAVRRRCRILGVTRPPRSHWQKLEGIKKRVFNPPKKVLEKLVWEKTLKDIGKEYGVEGSTVARRCNQMKIDRPRGKYWAKKLFTKEKTNGK